ncbi:hypothetical protein Syun_026425 [Stephania yunnanensis]|uniref:Uncharacterized protein n=1 Tax=Stephania yunnanensis TaxID=152371 RepID=A0AAP0EW65_9MAGN
METTILKVDNNHSYMDNYSLIRTIFLLIIKKSKTKALDPIKKEATRKICRNSSCQQRPPFKLSLVTSSGSFIDN